MGNIDYDNECMNDNHDRGCTCGEGRMDLRSTNNPNHQAWIKGDPYRPERPNVLYFHKANRANKDDTQLDFWVLRDGNGHRIAASCDFYESKERAMLNAIAIFGKEIWAGYHEVSNQNDGALLPALAIEIESQSTLKSV